MDAWCYRHVAPLALAGRRDCLVWCSYGPRPAALVKKRHLGPIPLIKIERGKRLLWGVWDGWDGSWDGLGRTLGRIKCAKSPMFTGLGTVGRINWGGRRGRRYDDRQKWLFIPTPAQLLVSQ
jgi:hypothetical protein